MDRQVLAALESFKRCLDGLVTTGSPDSATKRQYKADMTQVNAERHGRNEAALVPSQQRTRDNWYVTHVATHGSPFPFNDNLTTLMLIVACDLSESQRERLKSSLSLKGMNVTVYTFEAVKTVFVELFCTPKSSMENPALRVSGHGGSTNRVTKAILMTRNHVSGRGTIMSMHGNPKFFRTAKLKEEKGEGKGVGKGKVGFKRTGEAYLGEEQTQDTEWWSEEDCTWWSKGKKRQERVFERQQSTFLKVVSIPTIQRKVQKMIFNRVEDEERLRKDNVWKVPK